MTDYREVATRLLTEDMNAAPSETLLVVINTDTNHIGRVSFEAGVDLGLDSGLFEVPPMERNGMKPPESVVHAIESADVMVRPTSTSLTHTQAREAATETGTCIATMPGIADQMFSAGAITVDYEEVERLTTALTEKLTAADEARVEASDASTTMLLSGRNGIPNDGIVADPDDSGNLPSGESHIAPIEGVATGTLVFDGNLAGIGVLDDPLMVRLDAGYITSVESATADEFLDVTSGDGCARRVYELGLGTSPATSIIGTVLKDEKVYDTYHVTFGDNLGFGGTVDCNSHLNDIILEPTVSLDDDAVVADSEVYA